MVCCFFKLGAVILLVCLWSPRYVLGQRPTASIENPSPSLVTEGGSLPICVVLNMPPASNATVFISNQDSPSQTALGGEDYVVLQNAPLMFSPSDTRMCVDLQTQQDDIVENVEGLDVILTAGTDITVDVSTLRVNIIDNSTIQVAFAQSEVTVPESAAAQVCAVIASGQIDRSVSISFNVLLDTGTASSIDDYLEINMMRSFVPNGNGMQCITVITLTDQLVESDEFFEVSLTSQDSVILPSQPARVVIRDDDGATVVLQTPTDISTPEGNDGETMTVNLCVRLTNIMGGLQRNVVLNLTTVEVTAGSNDFVALDNQMLIIPFSSSVGVNQCQSVTIVGDNIRESDEMFQVSVIPADSDDTVTGSSTFSITINSEPGDDIEDCGPLPNIPNGRVELDPNTLENSTASYICDEGYDLIGDMSRTCQRQNAMWSGTEPTCTSEPIEVSFQRSIYTVDENVGDNNLALLVCVNASNATTEFTVTLSTENGTAIADMDFISTVVELTFSAGCTRMCSCIQITQDTELEEDEQFSVSLTTSNPIVILSTATTTVIIVDDDSREFFLQWINDSPRVEGNSVSAELRVGRAITSAQCRVTTRRPQDCSSGSTVTFTGLPPNRRRPYTFSVEATSINGERLTLSRTFRTDTIRDCWVHLINNGITIRGNSVTVEWQGTGAGESTTFTCQLDNRSLETCQSTVGYTNSQLAVGSHRLTIRPTDRNCRRRIQRTFTFVIESVE